MKRLTSFVIPTLNEDIASTLELVAIAVPLQQFNAVAHNVWNSGALAAARMTLRNADRAADGSWSAESAMISHRPRSPSAETPSRSAIVFRLAIAIRALPPWTHQRG
jgi:hypothetical protein